MKRGEDKLLLTRDDWIKRTSKESAEGQSSYKGRGGRGQNTSYDRSTMRCFNVLGHYVAECKQPRQEQN